MSRLLKIALREYLAYVRTLGFWLSMALMPMGVILAASAPAMMERSAPPPRLAVVDLTGQDYASAVAQALERPRPGPRGGPPRRTGVLAPSPPLDVRDPAGAARALRPMFEAQPPARIDAAAVIHRAGAGVTVDFWSRNLADPSLQGLVRDAIADRQRQDRLAALGLSPGQVASLDSLEPRIAVYSPRAGARQVSLRDRLPGFIGFALGMLLWALIFTGAGILLNSVIEEKSSRVLEVLLSSASIPEIMGGKILGVAGVSATVLGVWTVIGAIGLMTVAPQAAADIGAVLFGRGLALYFLAFLLPGYVIYACLFAAIGAHCETTREAQSLLGPVMMTLSVPVIFMGQAITRPDAPALAALSWFPLFTPFLMPARAAADPPLWQVIGTALVAYAAAAGSAWLSVQAFRAGALSGGRSDERPLLLRLLRPGGE